MTDEELLKIRNFGEKSLSELRSRLAEQGVDSGSPAGNGVLTDIGSGALAGPGASDDDRGMDGISIIQSSQTGAGLGESSGTAVEDDDEDEDDEYPEDDEDEEEA